MGELLINARHIVRIEVYRAQTEILCICLINEHGITGLVNEVAV